MKFDRHLFMVCVSEFIGTAILMCVGCASVVGITLPFYERNLAMIGIGFGLAVHISVHTLGTISGSHINPSVTIAAVMLGNMEWQLGCFYVLCQFLGGLTGYALLFASLTAYVRTDSFCVTKPVLGIEIWQAILIEFFLTCILVYFCCGAWDKRNPQVHDSLPIRFGLLIGGLIFAAAPYTGASMNVARSLPPAVLTNTWTGFWIYPVAHVPAAILVPLAWKYLHTAGSSDAGGTEGEA
ncbi:aquaporin AQPAn.G-like [Bactrocera neohumeralis]|uniref:aquaporin AQPAn.G-like n=1 Tax=Bactrocera tryoni TaxID=59916 RepID=UPI001A9597B8|nr:aquaporin AQPAn.G-like [Bactrocera tryoni]XP_050323398.1 aquaporin AQPAn.G-like [Bactrocera neohumeralis]